MKRICTFLLALVCAISLGACAAEPASTMAVDPASSAAADCVPVKTPSASLAPEQEAVTTEEPAPAAEPVQEELEQTTGFRIINYDDPQWFVNAHIQDLDSDWPTVYLDDLSSREALLSRADWYFERLFGNTAVTDVTLCVFEQMSFAPSENMDWIHEKAAYCTQNGQIALGMENSQKLFSDFYQAVTAYDIDWCDLAIDYCEKEGVRPWIYLRMNDLHGARYGENSAQHDSFWYEAQSNGWLIGEGYGTLVRSSTPIAPAYDFSHEEVRNWMLAYIEEMLMRYDVFGIQLDFMRNIYCFRYLESEGHEEIMTQFIRDVNALLEQAEAHHGHDMKLMIRLGANVEHNLRFGFDVKTWAEEGLVDAVVPSPEDFTDSGIPVEQWIEAVGDEVAVFTGFENNLIPMEQYTKLNHIKGIAAGYLGQGADGLYFNNFYQLGSEGPTVYPLHPEQASSGVRTFIVTRQDLVPIGESGYKPLPLELCGSPGGSELTICMGQVLESETVNVSVGYCISSEMLPVEVALNGVPPDAAEEREISAYSSAGYYLDDAYSVRQADVLIRYTFHGIASSNELLLQFSEAPTQCSIVSLEVNVSPF